MRAALLALLVACEQVEPAPEAEPCPAAGAKTAITSGLSGTEGVTFGEDGTLYVGEGDRVITVSAAGEVAELASVPAVVGLAWWGGAVWAASWEDEAGEDAASLYELTPDGGSTRWPLAEPLKPNFLLPTPWGTLLVSDDFDTRIFEVTDDGVATVWAEGLASPNGMGFSPDGGTLYVANTFSNPPTLQGVPVADGVAGTPETLATWELATTPDGLVVGEDGSVLVALNLANRIDVWSPGGEPAALVEDVPTVASLAFGRGAFDACSVVATSLFGDSVWLVGVGRRGP